MILAYTLYYDILFDGNVGGYSISFTLGSNIARATIILGPNISSICLILVYLDI